MRIFTTATFVLASLLAATATGDRTFNGTSDDLGKRGKFKSAAQFANGGGKMGFCPTGNCDQGQLVSLALSRLIEIDASNNKVQKASTFASLSATWTTLEPITINGTDALTTSFVTTFKVTSDTTTTFNLTAVIYGGNGTAMNGNQSVPVPSGGLKFSTSIKNWPFQATTNSLQFGLTLKARGKDNAKRGAPSKGKRQGNATHIDRLDMGEGMFMDAPTLAVIDGITTSIQAAVDTSGSEIEYIWTFPYFNSSVYYDPVVGSDDASATSTTSTPSPSPTTKGAATSSMVSLSLAGVVAVAGGLLL